MSIRTRTTRPSMNKHESPHSDGYSLITNANADVNTYTDSHLTLTLVLRSRTNEGNVKDRKHLLTGQCHRHIKSSHATAKLCPFRATVHGLWDFENCMSIELHNSTLTGNLFTKKINFSCSIHMMTVLKVSSVSS